MPKDDLTRIDAATFQPQLLSLAETIALKLDREGERVLRVPNYVATDLFVLIRYSQQAFAFLSYLNADERRESDIYWREQYSILGLTAVRTLIDCLYNITTILDSPLLNGRRFRCSGLKKFLLNLEEERDRYGSRPEWQKDLEFRQKLAERIAQETSVSFSEAKQAPNWKTLGGHLRESYGKDNEMQAFLRNLTLGAWSDYSALSHVSFETFIPHGLYFAKDLMPQERRFLIRENFPQLITMHLCRAAGVLACILTEVQGRCQFDSDGTAAINVRLCDIWDALSVSYEIKEFLNERYANYLADKRIRVTPTP